MLIETPPKGPGYGTIRLLIRGDRALDLGIAARLRPSYNDYPERRPFYSEYPAPGRRGPSRPASQPGTFTPPIGTGGGTYPGPIERPGSGITPGEIRAAGLNAGAFIQQAVTLATTVTQNTVSQLIGRPFIITHISHDNDQLNANSGIQVKVSEDNNITGGVNVPGTLIEEYSASQFTLRSFAPHTEAWPGFVWDKALGFLKIFFSNQSPATANMQACVELSYLD